MPIKESVKKSFRQSEKNKGRNLRRKKTMKELMKEALSLAGKGKKEELGAIIPKIYKSIDKAAKQNILKKNTASRKKSRIARLLSVKPQQPKGQEQK